MKLFLFSLLLLISGQVVTQTCIGKWITIDDKTGKKKGIIKLYKYKEQLYGEIIHVYPKEGQDENPICDKCSDDRKDKPVVGMQVVRNLKWDGKNWEGGTVLDPENGKVYTVKMWLDDENPDRLNVRGYIGPFFRTQQWIRVKE